MTSARTGRRRGDSGTREAILAAASHLFTEQGFRGTTMRAVAGRAGVDPALVHHFFGTKDQLFAAAMAFPFNPGDLVGHLLGAGIDGLGERLVRALLGLFAQLGDTNPMIGLLRSAAGHPPAAQMLREFLAHAVLDPLAAAVRADRPQLRAALCASQVVGILIAREVVALPALVEADDDTLVGAYGPTLQRYLTGDLPGPAPTPGR